jgi:hypothetical protein
MSKSCLPPTETGFLTPSFLSDDPALFASGGGFYAARTVLSNAFQNFFSGNFP